MSPVKVFAAAAAVLVGSATIAQAPTAAPAGLSTTGQPTAYDVNGLTYAVTGYRSALWGMTEAQVRQAIVRDLPGAVIAPPVVDPVTRVSALIATVPSLPPGPVPALVTYIFGASSHRLMHVNLVWTKAVPTAADRVAMVAAGSKVAADFLAYYWKLLSVARGVPTGPNGLVLFAGGGEKGGAVDVRLEGISYIAKTRGGDVASPEPVGPVVLRVGFAQTDGQPDVYRIKPGDF